MGKFEARNPKFETNSNDQKHKIQNKVHSDSGFWNFGFLDPFGCEFVSDFVLRISDFH